MSTLAFGTWPSPLSAADLAAGTVRLGDLRADGDTLYWTELRPSDDGRIAVVRHSPQGIGDVSPEGFNARTRVHEYGGGAIAVRGGRVVASDFGDQRLYDLRENGAEALTPAPDRAGAVRFADGELLADGQVLVCVRETHTTGREPRNEIVAVDLDGGAQHVLVTGPDFVAAPRVSPDGSELAWLDWDHPDMPWDGAALRVAPFHGTSIGVPSHLGGGGDAAAYRPVWLPDGRLVASLDETGFWELHVRDGDALRAVTGLGADVGFPHWQFGNDAFAPLSDGRVAAVVTQRAVSRLVLVDLEAGVVEDVELPYTLLGDLTSFGDGVAFLAGSPELNAGVVTWTPHDGPVEARRVELPQLRPGDRPRPEEIEVPTPDGASTHAFLYRPANAQHTGEAGERPPLLVFTHGGPTGNVGPVLSPGVAFWTSRGFAVADVNYRGSSGYGRVYRNALRGQWGVHDVTDTIAVARWLAEQGGVDPERMAIRGGSAGGFTTLAVLTAPEHPFGAGTSLFGVADLAGLAEDTHKFESRYLDRLIGPYPEAADLYRERSPLTHVDRLRSPILILQGLEDEIVPPAQSEQIVEAAARNGVPHAYVELEGEQHGFRQASSIVTWLESELAFYGQVFDFTPAGDLPRLELASS